MIPRGEWDADLIGRIGKVLVIVWRILLLALAIWAVILLRHIDRSQYTGPSIEDEWREKATSEQLSKMLENLNAIERNTRK